MNFNTLEEIGHKELARQGKYQRRIFCCTSTACLSAGAGQVHTTLDQAVAACKCDEHEAEVVKTGCMGLCSSAPLVRVEQKGKDPVLYGNLSPELAQHIVSRHVPMGEMEEESDSDEQDQSLTPLGARYMLIPSAELPHTTKKRPSWDTEMPLHPPKPPLTVSLGICLTSSPLEFSSSTASPCGGFL